MKTIILACSILLVHLASAQKELKQQWYLHFKALKDSVFNDGILLQRVHTDVLGNTFVHFLSRRYLEFNGTIDTGYCVNFYKVDKNGEIVWSKKLHDGLDTDGGGVYGIAPDNKGGLYVTTVLGSYYKLSEDSIFKGNQGSQGVVHWDENGKFKTITFLNKIDVGNLEMGLNGKLYLPRDRKTLHIINSQGKLENSYFPYYNDFSPHYAISKNGDVASIKGMISGDLFTIGDTTYKAQKSYSYVVVVRDSLGKVKWHKFFGQRGFIDIDDNHSLRWDKNNHLYLALNIISITQGYEKYMQGGGQKTILYKFDEFGNQKGEFFDTSQLEFAESYSVTWLMNDEQGGVLANLYTTKRNDTYYPNLTLKSEDVSGWLRIKFTEDFRVLNYYPIRYVPRIDNSNLSTKSVFWDVNLLTTNQSKEYYLPNGQSVTCKYDSDFFVIMMDTTEPKQNSTAKLGQVQVQVNLEPNPLQLNTTLQVQSKVQPIRSVFVLDVKGNKLKEQLNINLNKTSLLLDQKNGFKAGVYFVRIEFKNGESTTQKIVVTE